MPVESVRNIHKDTTNQLIALMALLNTNQLIPLMALLNTNHSNIIQPL